MTTRVPCTTEGCDGDGRYSAPGRGHLSTCKYPFDETMEKILIGMATLRTQPLASPPPGRKCAVCDGKFVTGDEVGYHARLDTYFHLSHDRFENLVMGENTGEHAIFVYRVK